MTIIFKIFFKNENIFKYMILFTILLCSFFIINILNNTISNVIFEKNNSFNNRKITIVLNKKNYIKKIKSLNYIEEIKKIDDYEYDIIFNDFRDVDTFTKSYSSFFTKVTYYGDSSENKSVLSYLNTILKISSYIVIIILFIILIVCIFESFLDFIPDLSLFKLIGMTNRLLSKLIFIFFLCLFSLTFWLIYFIFSILVFLINTLFKIKSFIIINISFCNLLILYLLIVISIVIIVLILYKKLKKISPVCFVKKNTIL